jgi:NADH-quinone oxidoreductase subunit L
MISLALIPALPLASAALLLLSTGRMPRSIAALLGAGSVGLAALLVAGVAIDYLDNREVRELVLWTWMEVGNFRPRIALYSDGLTVVMMSVITGVGFLIHLYSTEFMWEDESFCRYFAYMNLFVGAMLLLVMGDNLLLLFLGWEGVGMCSYLLIGFWYRDAANGAAARKSFVVTRIGDALMALGMLLLFTELGTLDIQPLMAAAGAQWARRQCPAGARRRPARWRRRGQIGAAAAACVAARRDGRPDAGECADPRGHHGHRRCLSDCPDLRSVPPRTAGHGGLAWIGLATLLLAAFTALVQHDIKRILAYSTISQIGYMFLALGVGAFSASIFHLVTHAFFKALLFLAAGTVIHCLHHEHDIFRMGGLRTRLPVVFWSFVIGSAALAALPLTSGFYSKDAILLLAWDMEGIGPVLWLGGLLGALLTSIYSFRLVFIVFFGPAQTEPDRQPGWRMAVPLSLLCLLSLVGGWFVLPLAGVLPESGHPEVGHAVEFISIGVPLLGLALAYLLFLGRQLSIDGLKNTAIGQGLERFWFMGWMVDSLYHGLIVAPYTLLARWWRNEPVDWLYGALVGLSRFGHRVFIRLQTGELRWYATTLAVGLILVLSIVLRPAA